MSQSTFQMNDKHSIPSLGLGTWQSPAQQVEDAVDHAIKSGYRHIDCAWAYQNEGAVGKGIKKSGVKREDVFITSKLWGTYHTNVEANIDETLSNLGVDYLDLYLMHWPIAMNPEGKLFKASDKIHMVPFRKKSPEPADDPSSDLVEWSDGTKQHMNKFERDLLPWKIENVISTWKAMEDLVAKGKARSIGVSNVSKTIMDQLLPHVAIKPAANQLEIHLYNPDHELVSYLQSHGIVVEAYSPLGSTGCPILEDDVVVEIANTHSVKPADIALGWLLEKSIVPLPKSVTSSRIADNFNGAYEAAKKLTPEDVSRLDGLAASGKQKRIIKPEWGVNLHFNDW